GQVTFIVEQLQERDESVLIRFSVSDTGIGIANDSIDDIFIPYQQIDNQITRSEGSGLGLTISKNLIELMGETLKVQSELGVGSRFWFDLTLPISHQTPPLADEHALGQTISGYQGPRRTILSIDDNHFNRDVIRQHLTHYGFDVDEAPCGEEGLTMLAQNQPDLILLDILMPDMDGFAVVKQIRRHPDYQQLPVIALTAATHFDVEAKALASGFNAILIKPVDEDTLLGALQSALNLQWTVAAPAEDPEPASVEPMVLPDETLLRTLKEHAETHNILAIRAVIKTLEQDGGYGQFTGLIEPLARRYQFAKIIEVLEGFL
ncbi:MAG: CheY-like chemotaxis protein, partial [Phenylobacterium sp.]